MIERKRDEQKEGESVKRHDTIAYMKTSISLQSAIDELVIGKDTNKIRDHVTTICKRYMYESGNGKRLVETNEEVVAYAVSRMPATYASVYSALSYMCELYHGNIQTLLDYGSGTGTVCWAANDLFALNHITCVEREEHMIEIAKKLMQLNEEDKQYIEKVNWICSSVTSDLELPQADLVTASYIMNELNDSEKQKFLNNLWKHSKDVIMVIEPGTTVGYHNIRTARSFFLEMGASIIAPCSHSNECDMEPGEWCHFACRVERSKLQRYVKNGDAPYEDERYSYIIVTKNEIDKQEGMRILCPPKVNKGFVDLTVCTTEGIKNVKVTARNKNEYKTVKRAKWGDISFL